MKANKLLKHNCNNIRKKKHLGSFFLSKEKKETFTHTNDVYTYVLSDGRASNLGFHLRLLFTKKNFLFYSL